MSVRKVSISFKEKDLRLYEYLKSQDNASAYVVKLIRDDTEKKGKVDFEEKVAEVVKKILRNSNCLNHIEINYLNESTPTDALSADEKEIINSIF